jgi:hypothetical protein
MRYWDGTGRFILRRLLPLTLTLGDYAATENLAYYAPWGNLAIFHKGFRCDTKSRKMLKLKIDVEGTPITVTLDDNATARNSLAE